MKFLLNFVVAGTFCVLGVTGNTISYIVLSKDKETQVASFLLKSLGVVDNCFLTLWFINFSLRDLFTYLDIARSVQNSWFVIKLCTHPLMFVSQSGTIWMTVLIAVSRYIAVCKPYKAAQYCALNVVKRASVCVLLFAFLYNFPRFFETKIITVRRNNSNVYSYRRTDFADSRYYNVIYFDILYYIFSFALPLLILAVLNTKLTIAYRQLQTRRRSMQTRHDTDHSITLVMIMVVLVFMLCNAPAGIYQMLQRYRWQPCLSHQFILQETSSILEVFNSSVNFIIYCAFRKKFRTILHGHLCASLHHRNTPICGTTRPGSLCLDATERPLRSVLPETAL